MAEWVKVGTSVLVGAGAGIADQLVQNWDEGREAEAGKKIGMLAQGGTYFNYGVPILAILAAAMGWLKGDWATRLLTLGSQLAGRKGTYQFTKRRAAAWTAWSRDRQLEERARQLAEAERARQAAMAAGARVGIEF